MTTAEATSITTIAITTTSTITTTTATTTNTTKTHLEVGRVREIRIMVCHVQVPEDNNRPPGVTVGEPLDRCIPPFPAHMYEQCVPDVGIKHDIICMLLECRY